MHGPGGYPSPNVLFYQFPAVFVKARFFGIVGKRTYSTSPVLCIIKPRSGLIFWYSSYSSNHQGEINLKINIRSFVMILVISLLYRCASHNRNTKYFDTYDADGDQQISRKKSFFMLLTSWAEVKWSFKWRRILWLMTMGRGPSFTIALHIVILVKWQGEL